MPAAERAKQSPTGEARARERSLSDLLRPLGVAAPEGLSVRGIEYDSRNVCGGELFIAVRGLTTDGHLYVNEARARGAVAALVEEPVSDGAIPEFVVADTRGAMGLIAHDFYGRPCEALNVHGITGTNGKTTTSYLVDSILRKAGLRTGVVGTLGYRVRDEVFEGERTSPESLDLARILSSMVDADVDAVTMEVSSHALALKRTAGAKFDSATFTNISRDHLDFHGTFEDYAAAKRMLFEQMAGEGWKEGATAVVNIGDELGAEIAEAVRSVPNVALITYGDGGDVSAVDVVLTPAGTSAVFRTPRGEFNVHLSLISDFNVVNALAATGVALAAGVGIDAIREGLEDVSRVDGRLEPVEAGQDFTIIVDYAHTPDALERVLATLRRLGSGRIITVFGCGGDRDRGKRQMMGEIAAAGSDSVIVTSDNPRSEDPGAIIDEILEGVEPGPAGKRIAVIEDRREAIERAVAEAMPGDIVLIAGKGHEDYQIIGAERAHFDDREEAAAAVARSGRGRNGEGSVN